MYSFPANIEKNRMEALAKARPLFNKIDEISTYNTMKVLKAFASHQVSDYHFRNTTGYGYGDAGREKLDEVYAEVFQSEKALVRSQFVSGTHALATVLFGLLRPGDELLSITGAPYDTMQTVIGAGKSPGSLLDFGVTYSEVAMKDNIGINYSAIPAAINEHTKMVLIQRSRGYSMRKPLTVAEIGEACDYVKKIKPECICFVDNCYGEFVEINEPTAVGADIMAGSLIKNPGGGIASTGGYIAGKADLVELAATRLTAPGIGSELGASLADNRLLYQGLFLAPHTVAQALKGSVFSSLFFSLLGYNTFPLPDEPRSDIIQAIELGTAERMIAFCRGLQRHSPVDSHVRPEPSQIPGYADAVIMAGGTFVQGSSIELSADGPIRPPYAVYLQGGLTLEHVIIGVMGAAVEMVKTDCGNE
jgi:cystathionine beta-lyase family protein involved in aluminum resistance